MRHYQPWNWLKVAVLCALSANSYADINLTFGLYAADKPTQVVAQFRPVLTQLEQDLTATLGEPVIIHTRISPTYDLAISRLAKGEVDFARFGPASYVLSKQKNPQIRLLAMENKSGKNTRSGYIIAYADSGYTQLSQLAGQSFAFGSEESTIGRYFAQLLLSEAGVNANDLTHHQYLGRHDKVGAAVAAGTFTAGALKSSTYKKLIAANQPVRILKKFSLATKAWAAREQLPAPISDALISVLIQFVDAKSLKILGKDGFFPADDSAYNRVRDAIKSSEAFFAE